jgi:integrase
MGRRAKGEGSITRHPKGHWQAELLLGRDENGERKRKYLTGKTQREVKEKLDELKQQLNAGVYSDTKTTVKQYLTEWLEAKRGQVEPKTLEGYARTAKHLNRHLGGVQLSKLSSQEIQRALGAIRDESAEVVKKRCEAVGKAVPISAGVRTANQCRTNLHTALEDAVTAVPPVLMRNPVAVTKTLKAESEEVVIWTPNHMQVFLARLCTKFAEVS